MSTHEFLRPELVQLHVTRAQLRQLVGLAASARDDELHNALLNSEREFDLALDWYMRLSETARAYFKRRAGHLGVVGMYYSQEPLLARGSK